MSMKKKSMKSVSWDGVARRGLLNCDWKMVEWNECTTLCEFVFFVHSFLLSPDFRFYLKS